MYSVWAGALTLSHEKEKQNINLEPDIRIKDSFEEEARPDPTGTLQVGSMVQRESRLGVSSRSSLFWPKPLSNLMFCLSSELQLTRLTLGN